MKRLFSIIKNGSLLLVVLASLNSCKIDVIPNDRYTDQLVWKNPSNIDLYITGMYNEFKNFAFGQFPIGYNNATDALTDVMKFTSTTSGNGTVNILAMDASRVSSSSPQMNYWENGYDRIRRLNEFLEGLDKYATVNDASKQSYQAEARFIRGYVYFWLVKLNGSVILLDKTISDNNHPRSSEDSCYNFIAKDFAFAAAHLPAQWPDAQGGRATMGAAFGMLARTWLYAASIAKYDNKQFNQDPLTGIPADKANTYYQNAADAAGEVMKLADQGYYALETDFSSVFTNRYSKESLFTIDYSRPQLTHYYDLGFAPPKDEPSQALVYGVPTAELVDEFEMANGTKFSWSDATMAANPYTGREPRFYATVLYNGAPWKNRTITSNVEDPVEGFVQYGSVSDPKRTVTGYYAKKLLDPTNNAIFTRGSVQTWKEMRYAEVLLIHAEAMSGLNNISKARESLDKVRARVQLPPTAAATQQQMMDAIEHERKVELAFEGQRYWDLRRWRKAHLVLNNTRFHGHKISSNGAGFTYETVTCDNANRQFTTQLYYFPIVNTEIQRNPSITQIKGW